MKGELPGRAQLRLQMGKWDGRKKAQEAQKRGKHFHANFTNCREFFTTDYTDDTDGEVEQRRREGAKAERGGDFDRMDGMGRMKRELPGRAQLGLQTGKQTGEMDWPQKGAKGSKKG